MSDNSNAKAIAGLSIIVLPIIVFIILPIFIAAFWKLEKHDDGTKIMSSSRKKNWENVFYVTMGITFIYGLTASISWSIASESR
jgi:uncharacterized protein YqhQ